MVEVRPRLGVRLVEDEPRDAVLIGNELMAKMRKR
jgi:hypothetical protein